MRKVIVWLALCALMTGCASTAGVSRLQGHEAPGARMFMLDGTVKSVEDYRGKNVVLLFWATTCTFSRTVVERLNDFEGQYGAQKNAEVVAISVDKLQDQDKLKERVSLGGLEKMSHAFSGNDIHDEAYIAYEVESLPTVVVVDPKGTVVASGSSDDVVYDYFKVS